MKIVATFRVTVLTLASAGMLVPQTAVMAADDTSAGSPQIAVAEPLVQDVALASGGVLRGQVLDPQGLPIAQAPVTVWAFGQQVASTQTDADGNFVVDDLRGGNYTVVAGEGTGVYRLWAENSAPPHASQSVLIVDGRNTARGQSGGGFSRRGMTIALGLFLGGIIAGGMIGSANAGQQVGASS